MSFPSPSAAMPRRCRATARRGLAATLFLLGAASCSRLPTNEVAADGGVTTTYVTTPPTSAPRTTAPTTTALDSAKTTVPDTTLAPTTTEAPATTQPPTTEPPTTAAPTTVAPTTAAPTTAAPTTAAPTTVPPTTVTPTTVAPTTAAPTTAAPEGDELEELPYTGPSEAVLFALIGLTMIVAGRSVLDLTGVLARVNRVGENLPPR
ncbi:MAG: hypothetical protein R2710_02205 [Acidimicrobiales bacterium]